jgi:hypothetical protein
MPRLDPGIQDIGWFELMDCRVEPGNDKEKGQQ